MYLEETRDDLEDEQFRQAESLIELRKRIMDLSKRVEALESKNNQSTNEFKN